MWKENKNLNKHSRIPTASNNINLIGFELIFAFWWPPTDYHNSHCLDDEHTSLPHPSCTQCLPLHLALSGLGWASAGPGLRDSDHLPLPYLVLDEG